MFRAYESTRERLVAVKLFKLDLPPERVHQLVAELERVVEAHLDHPALAAPLGTGIVGVSAYLAQEYVAADALDSVVREYGAAAPADALRVAAQLGGALDFAGVADIAHGAMHPRDILLSSDDTRLTGVGVARALEKVGVPAPVRRPYTAPERIAGRAWDRRADVFSLAAVVHELLWARRPAGTGARSADALTDVEGGDLDALRAAFARALAENPADRFETALEFAQALSAAFPGITIATPEPRGRHHLKRQSNRHSNPHSNPQSAIHNPQVEESRLPLLADADPGPELPHDVVQASRPAVEPTPGPAPLPVVLKPADEECYRDVEVAPAIVDEVVPAPPAVSEAPEVPHSMLRNPQFEAVIESSRSAVWPLVLALGVGLAVGFAGGYGVGTHSRPDGAASAAPASDAPKAAVPAPPTVSTAAPAARGREFTESTVPAAPRPAPAPASASGAAIRNPQTAMSASQPGRLLVRSTPAGARVAVDGTDYGRTPVAVRELTRGAHRLRVTRDGYAAVERRVTITSERPSQSVTIQLARASDTPRRAAPPGAPSEAGFAGALLVDSRPPGAKVFVDGKLAGTTPLSMAEVRAGEHAIRIERDGYRGWSSSVRVVAAEQNRVTASLER